MYLGFQLSIMALGCRSQAVRLHWGYIVAEKPSQVSHAPVSDNSERAWLIFSCSNICSTEVNEAYIDYLTKLNEKMEYASSADPSQVIAFKELSPHLENLKLKVFFKESKDTSILWYINTAYRPWPRSKISSFSGSMPSVSQTLYANSPPCPFLGLTWLFSERTNHATKYSRQI